MRQSDILEALRAENLPGWLCVGYGTSRVLPDPRTSPAPQDPAVDRLRPLFGNHPIVGTDFIDYLGIHDPALVRPYVRALGKAFKEEDLLPLISRFEQRGHGGARTASHLVQSHRFSFKAGAKNVKVPATWLSQGYQATIAWVADLIGQAFWDKKEAVEPEEIQGICLIDELDLHLHPRWQLGLVRTLKRVFPKVQFIVTTHSPMLLPGLEADEILRLHIGDKGHIEQLPEGRDPRLMTGTDLYQSYFGVSDYYPSELGRALARFGALAGDPGRSPAEERELDTLDRRLREEGLHPGWEPVPVDPDLQRS